MTFNEKARFGDQWPNADGGCRGGAPAKLDGLETSDTATNSHTYRAFLASGCKKDLDHARAVYRKIDTLNLTTKIVAFDGCKSRAWFTRNIQTNEVRVVASRCHLRWCPLCIKTKTFIITQSVSGWLKARKDCKFLTVTLRHNSLPIAEQVDRLYDCFRKLRRRKWFLSAVKGGIWFFQIKQNKKTGLWHPHIHFLVEGGFIPRKRLSKEWLEITGDSMIVDVRPVKEIEKAAEYVARYAAAPCRLADLDLETSVDLVQALHSRRICGTWGTGAEIKLSSEKPTDAADWVHLAAWSWVVQNRKTNPEAAAVMAAFTTRKPLEFEYPPDPPAVDALASLEFADRWEKFIKKVDKPVSFRQVSAEYNMQFYLWS